MSNENKDIDEKIIQGHEYDGIQELDNPLPNWWLWLFLFSIVFAFLYFIHYELGGGGLSSDQALQAQLAHLEQQRKVSEKGQVVTQPEDLETIMASPARLAQGQQVFAQYCASCHGAQGQGVIGPNLTDAYWLHSKGDFEGIMAAINIGFPNKGMPPWKTMIPEAQKNLLAAFVISIQGTSPKNPKAPQGNKIE